MHLYLKYGLFFLVNIVLVLNTCYCQTYSLFQYTPEDGLPSSTVYDIDQDSNGLIWLGTENGLSVFDGIQFDNFSINEGLPGNTIYGVAIDHEDKKWLSILGQNVAVLANGEVEECSC